MELSRSLKVFLIIIVVAVVAFSTWWFYIRVPLEEDGDMPQLGIKSVLNLDDGDVSPSLGGVLPDDVLLGQDVEIRQSQVRKISNGSEQSVLVYSADVLLPDAYQYFKNYFVGENLRITTDSLDEDKFVLDAIGGTENYNIFARSIDGSTIVNVSLVKTKE